MAGNDNDIENLVGKQFNIPDAAPADDNASQDGGGSGDGGEGGAQPSSQNADPQSQGEQQQPPAQQQDDKQAKDGDKQYQQPLFEQAPRKGPNGELLDKDGNVIATTRREKQLAYNLNRTQHNARLAHRDLAAARQQIQQYEALNGLMRANNLQMPQVQEALQLRAAFETNPIEAARDVVARVLQAGYTMEQLFGAEAVPGINARIINQALDKRLAPLTNEAQARQSQQRSEAQAREAYDAFLADNPYADVHGEMISQLVSDQGLTPQQAYNEVRVFAARHGLDFSEPLEAQFKAKHAKQPAQQPRNGGGGGNAPTPGNRQAVADVNGQGVQERTPQQGRDFNASEPWKNIASRVYAEMNRR